MSRNQSPVNYDKDAIAPRFRNEFLKPLHADDQVLIQKYFGQALLGRNVTQTILLLDGATDTGKTTLAKIMRNLIGEENSYQLRTSFLNDRFEIGRYRGKTFLLGADVNAKFLSTEGASGLKGLVGGDYLPAELKQNNSRFTVEGVFNIVITSNCRLLVKLQGDTEAWRRRLLIVRYEKSRSGGTIDDFDKVLIEQEGSGILNFALEGVAMLYGDLAGNGGRIRLTPTHKTRLSKLLDESDSLRVFLRDSLAQDPKRDLTVDEILTEYFKECITDELTPIPLPEARRMLEPLMMELFAVSRSNSIRRAGKNQRGFSTVYFKP